MVVTFKSRHSKYLEPRHYYDVDVVKGPIEVWEATIGFVPGDYYGFSPRSKLPLNVRVKLTRSEMPEISFTARVWNPRGSDIVEGGQMQDTIRELLRKGILIPAPGFTYRDIEELLGLWDEYHLNASMPVPYRYKDLYLRLLEEAERRGLHGTDLYKFMKERIPEYGSRHYYWPLPPDIRDRLNRIFKTR